jgi:Kef-type K+ transport system membrane component KefB
MPLHLSSISGLGLLLLCGYLCGQLARAFKLPALIGYLAAGVLLGKSGLHIFTTQQLEQLSFIPSLSLGCIAFLIGSELQLSSLKKLGSGIIVVLLAESFMAFFLVTAAIFLFTGNLPLSLLLGSLAPATAPAGTVAVIQEYRAKGTLTKALYIIVAFDDGLAVIIFGFALAVSKALLSATADMPAVSILTELWKPLQEIGLSLALGTAIGGFFSWLIRKTNDGKDKLIVLFWAVLFGVGIAERYHLSPIIVCMTIGFLFTNICERSVIIRTRAVIQQIMGLLFVLFFGMAGLHLDPTLLPDLGLIGVTYIVARSAGKLIGAWAGASTMNMSVTERRYLGLGLLSQAGVAIGLALLVRQELSHIPGAELVGLQILSIITATSIVFEIIGPIAAKYALLKTGDIQQE